MMNIFFREIKKIWNRFSLQRRKKNTRKRLETGMRMNREERRLPLAFQ